MQQQTENETFLNHLRAQLSDLKAAKARFEEMEDEINEMEQNFLMLKQERAENEAQLEENIKTHAKILEGVKAENNFMMKNLMDKQVLNENSFQLVNAKKQELGQVRQELAAAEVKLESLGKMGGQLDDKIAAARARTAQVAAEKAQQQAQISEMRENLRVLNEQVTDLRMGCIEREKECLLAEKRKDNHASVLDEKRQELRQLQSKAEAAKAEVDAVKEQMEAKTRQIKDIKQQSTQLANDHKDLTAKLTEEIESNREIEDKIEALKGEIERATMRKIDIDDQCKAKARRLEELTDEADAVQAKRVQLQKQSSYLQENINKFAKIAQKSKINFKGSEMLRKEDAYTELAANFEALTTGKY